VEEIARHACPSCPLTSGAERKTFPSARNGVSRADGSKGGVCPASLVDREYHGIFVGINGILWAVAGICSKYAKYLDFVLGGFFTFPF
jgi:hypothetical protein